VTDITEVLSLALAGVGIAYVHEALTRRYIREAQSAVEHDGLFLYFPRRASLAPKLRAFIDVAKKSLKSFAAAQLLIELHVTNPRKLLRHRNEPDSP
jgi:DNA-binding transcriptional LysR family regulator